MLPGFHSHPDPLMQSTQEPLFIAGRLQQLGYESLPSMFLLLGLILLKETDSFIFCTLTTMYFSTLNVQMAEISRILKPGGVFVATTFLSPIPIIDFGSKGIRKVGQSFTLKFSLIFTRS
jgi:SAM-dependent methyltransferase